METKPVRRLVTAAALAAVAAVAVRAQATIPADSKCQPIAQRSSRVGCWIVVDQPVGTFAQPQVSWYIDKFPTRAAADAAAGTHGTAVDALEQHWVMTIAPGDPAGRPHTASVGPLPIKAGTPYSAMYMETINPPGFASAVHTHSGPEAWFQLAGSMCLETPEGLIRDGVGSHGVFVRGDIPMLLTTTGTTERRALVLILHETARPPISIERTWAPQGGCKAG